MIYNIQVARCIGMFVVLAYHGQDLLTRFYDTEPTMPRFLHGAIDMFFVASGFIMFHILRDGDRTPYQFLADRFIRVYPIYWLTTTLFVALYLIGLQPAFVSQINFDDFLHSMALIPDIRADGRRAMIVEQAWTLIFEMYFYVLLGLSLFLGSQLRSLIALTVIFGMGPIILHYTDMLPMPLEYVLRPITLEFVAGGILAMLYRQPIALPKRAWVMMGWASLLGGLAIMMFWSVRYEWAVWSNFEIRVVAFGIPATMVVAGLLLLEKGEARWRSKTMLFLGAASYTTYIFHMFGLQYTMTVLTALWPGDSSIQILTVYWASVVVSLASCAAVYAWLEIPMTKGLKAGFRKLHPNMYRERAKNRALAGA